MLVFYHINGWYYDTMIGHMPYHYIYSQQSFTDFALSYICGGEL